MGAISYESLEGRGVRFSLVSGEDVIGKVKSAERDGDFIEVEGIGESRDVWVVRDKIVSFSILGPKKPVAL